MVPVHTLLRIMHMNILERIALKKLKLLSIEITNETVIRTTLRTIHITHRRIGEI